MTDITLEIMNSIPEPTTRTNIARIVHRRIESGFEFDARNYMPFFDTAILTFRVVHPCVFLQQQDEIEQNIPVHILEKLKALENQVYRGPNRIPRPSCVNPLFSALGIGRSEEMSQTAWQQWLNLGTMSMKSAAAKYLHEVSKFCPNMLNESFESDGKTLSVQTGLRILAAYILQRKFRQRRTTRPIRMIGMKIVAFEKIQRFLIHMMKRKHLIETRLFAQEINYKKLIQILLRGIPIHSLINGKMVPEYLSVFKVGEPDILHRRTGKYVLYTSSKEKVKAVVDVEKGILLSDVAEIRSGCENFPKSKRDGYPNADLCFSIIASQKTFYLQFVQDLEVQVKPAPPTAAKPTSRAKEISKPAIWDDLEPFGGKSMGWIMRVFPNLVESTLSQEEASSRGRFKGYTPTMKKQNICLELSSIKVDAELFSTLLVRGIRVDVWKSDKSSVGGAVKEAEWESKVMYINWNRRRINVGEMPKFGVMGDPSTNMGIFIEDMAEIRRGRVLPEWDEKFHFEVPYQSDVNKTKVMTIVAGENSITIRLKSSSIRNKFVNMFRAFMQHFKYNYSPLSSAAINPRIVGKDAGKKNDKGEKLQASTVSADTNVRFIGNDVIPSVLRSNKSSKSGISVVNSLKSAASTFGMLGKSKPLGGIEAQNNVQNFVDEQESVQSRATRSSDQHTVKSASTLKSLKKMAKRIILGPKRESGSTGSEGGNYGKKSGTDLEVESKDGTNASSSEQAIAPSQRSDSSSIYSSSKR